MTYIVLRLTNFNGKSNIESLMPSFVLKIPVFLTLMLTKFCAYSLHIHDTLIVVLSTAANSVAPTNTEFSTMDLSCGDL